MFVKRRMPRLSGSDRGVTLVELLVVMGLLSVLGTIVSVSIMQAEKTTRQDQNRSYAGDALQKGVERISRELRVADPLRVAEPSKVVVDVYRNKQCLRIQWWLKGTTVQQRTQTFNAPQGNTSDASNGCADYAHPPTPISDSGALPFLVDNGNGSAPLFTYFDHNHQPTPTGSVSDVASVDVVLVQSLPENRAPVRVETLVNLRNSS